ncbi:2-oxoglutarate/Fe(II)-dependent dioxygenase, putative [Bodo saltans]|uniref:2-oxoglutarate/Fe(II)-dependent dioxygenase, putative n=1 Tax=Bodo saltans TaxID=75058 RepID=A0A0S4JVQ8_BODSA|nr:2-oxoglutarate/Fe(II)-dependent dioxygenase, putative [Bodo saltans]|eukprot:CUG94320.1 2-oxoglutarate/Fe(II)-dependent dioxygenase, putative [Bodo saltans]
MSSVCLCKTVSRAAANELVDALQAHGYCYLKHDAVSPTLLKEVKTRGRNFFTSLYPSLSEFHKESLRTEMGYRGFYRYVGASGRDDAIDCFSIGRDIHDPQRLRQDYYASAGWESSEYMPKISRVNPWGPLLEVSPNAGREFQQTLLTYYDACHEVSMDALRHIACALGIKPAQNNGEQLPDDAIDEDYFVSNHSKRDHNLEVKFYPQLGRVARSKPIAEVRGASEKNPTGPKVLRRKTASAEPLLPMAAASPGSSTDRSARNASPSTTPASSPLVRLDKHSDLSTITLLAQDVMGGLEVYDETKEAFIEVPVLEDALLMNAGMFLERWTDGFIEATPHRVRSVGTEDRCSVVFFCFPNHDAVIDPMLQANDNPALAQAASFTAGDMMPPVV